MTKQSFNFGKAYQELEELVADFEERELDLDKDIPKFEKGLKLAQQLKKHLAKLENKVTEINASFTVEADENEED